jgi:glyoxylase-like metal-dependent hydrolase (beta-lactamase superfamily II)
MVRVHSHTGGFTQTNGYVVASDSGACVVIDAPGGMAEWLEAEGLRPSLLLLTHAHFDHVIDAARVKAEIGCPVHAFATPDPDLTLEAAYAGMGIRVNPYEVDERIVAGGGITVGDLHFECFHVPGHSPDSVCFYLPPREPNGRPMLFCGDVLFQGSIGRTDFPHGDHDLLLQGIQDQLFGLPDDTVVFPGHGPVTSIGIEKQTNPYVRLRG